MTHTETPSALFGTLFETVQSQRIYPDSKAFADAVPIRSPDEIMADWEQQKGLQNHELREFVEANFILPGTPENVGRTKESFEDYLRNAWSSLTRDQVHASEFGSALSLPRPFVVPGGRFRELYYWDSYFTMLGFAHSGRLDLVEDMIENLGSLLDRFGMIPNASRTYYLGRSHPPVFYLMAAMSQKQRTEDRQRRLDWMLKEYVFWMDGAQNLMPGSEARHAVRLRDGALLNRYWDDYPYPRDESWAEDVNLASNVPEHARPALWRDLRAAAESGWDFSSRWFADNASLETIRTTRLLPIDLNGFLYGLEQAIANESGKLGLSGQAELFAKRADARLSAIQEHFWNEELGSFADYDLDAGKPSDKLTAAGAVPLFVGLASKSQAERAAVALRRLLMPGGLCTTLRHSGQQWDAPNGWAPLQWIAFAGLRACGEAAFAEDLAKRWLAVVERNYLLTGQIFEKYDVATGGVGGGGEYAVEIGFGWTNGVCLALMDTLDRC